MRNKKVLILLSLIVLLAVIATVAVIRKKKLLAAAEAVGMRPVPVTAEDARTGEFVTSKRYVGIIEPLTTANISSRITSEVVEIFHWEGESVKKGTMLIQLDDRNFVQAISVARAKIENVKTQIASNNVSVAALKNSVDYWKKQVERDVRLCDQDIVPVKQLETSREKLNEVTGQYNVAVQKGKTLDAVLSAAEGELKLAETNLSYANVKAPFDCVVCDVPVDPGDLASPGKKLMVVEDHQHLKVVIKIPQVDMRSVKIGDKIDILSRTAKLIMKITKIYPSVGVNKMVRLDARLPDDASSKFVSGQYVLAYLDSKVMHDALIVPSKAINIDNNPETGSSVFKVVNGTLKKIPVKIIADNEKEAAVSGDIHPGDKVVVSAFLGWAKLADGLKVIPSGK